MLTVMKDTKTAEPLAVRVAEAARQLGISVRQLYYLADAGEIAVIRHPSRHGKGPGAVRVEQSEINRYLAAHRTAVTTP